VDDAVLMIVGELVEVVELVVVRGMVQERMRRMLEDCHQTQLQAAYSPRYPEYRAPAGRGSLQCRVVAHTHLTLIAVGSG